MNNQAAQTMLERAVCETLRHMLGLTDFAERLPREFYRDYFCASRGDELLASMAADGLVTRYAQCTNYDWYTTTDEGKRIAIESFKAKAYSKPRRRYHAFLRVSDCHPDLTFHEYLTSPDYAEHRRNA